MKANELRIGNLVYADTGLPSLEVHTLMAGDIPDIASGRVKIEPIPLTEEWLAKFGFNYCDSKIIGKPKKLTIQVANTEDLDYEDGEFFISNSSDNRIWGIGWGQPKYVHQLQNLYFALTNEELTFKDL